MHPDRVADAICHRCGDHACDECRRTDGSNFLCSACAARYLVVVPWEDRSLTLAQRILRSLDGLVLRPSRVMARLPRGARGPAHSLLFVVVFFPGVAVQLIGGAGAASIGSALSSVLFVTLAAWTGGLSSAFVARLSGAHVPAAQIGRAVVYAYSAQCVATAVAVVPSVILGMLGQGAGTLPMNVLVLTAVAVMGGLVFRSVHTFARGALELSAPRAVAVAIASVSPPFLLVLGIAIIGFGGYFLRQM